MSKSRGFTLIELLVVIAIISILSVVGMVTYTNLQKGARDAKRKVDVNAIADVLEAHYSDTTSPCNASAAEPYCATVSDNFFSGGLPHAPGGTDYPVQIGADKTTYTVCALLENNNGNSSTAGDGTDFTPASGASATNYCRKNQQ